MENRNAARDLRMAGFSESGQAGRKRSSGGEGNSALSYFVGVTAFAGLSKGRTLRDLNKDAASSQQTGREMSARRGRQSQEFWLIEIGILIARKHYLLPMSLITEIPNF